MNAYLVAKCFLMGLISMVFVTGAIELVTPIDSEAMFKKKKSFSPAQLVKKILKKTVCDFRNPGQRFVTSKDGKEVCDRTTGVIWEPNPQSNNGRNPMNQSDVIDFCADLEKGNGKVYELQSIQQLMSLSDYTERDPALPPEVYCHVPGGGSRKPQRRVRWGPFDLSV